MGDCTLHFIIVFDLHFMCFVIIAVTEDNLLKAAHKLNQIIAEYVLTISVQKTKSMAFKGRDPVRTKIVIDNKIIEQVNLYSRGTVE
jgi:hypothetical protein